MKERALDVVSENPEVFRPDFADWLDRNFHVYEAFQREANRVVADGWKHYSARTIMEVLRHRSNVRELDGDYKISNNMIPDCARLYMMLNPGREGLFTLKHSEFRMAA
jgi:hypothetical protein